MKRDNEQLKEKNDSLGVIVETLRSAPDSEVGEIVNHIRGRDSLPDIAISIKESRPGPLTQLLETELSDAMDKFRISGGGELGYGSSWIDESSGPRESRSSSGSWTKVTSDVRFITELLVSHWPVLQQAARPGKKKEENTNEAITDFVFHVEPPMLCPILQAVPLDRYEHWTDKILQFTIGKRDPRTGMSFLGSTRG